MSDTETGAEAPQQEPELPPELALLWGRREPARRGPRPELTPVDIVRAAVEIADAEGFEAVSMARVAKQLGFSTMALYRHVANKDELVALMWNESASIVNDVVLEGDTWRERLTSWAVQQQAMLDRHPWLTTLPIANPPMGPSALRWVDVGLETLADTPLDDDERMLVIGTLSAFSLAEGRLAHDAHRAAAEAQAAGAPFPTFEQLVGYLADPAEYPHLARVAAGMTPAHDIGTVEYEADANATFLFGLDLILDGVEALIARAAARQQSR